jgi:hypothetical protein
LELARSPDWFTASLAAYWPCHSSNAGALRDNRGIDSDFFPERDRTGEQEDMNNNSAQRIEQSHFVQQKQKILL